MFGEQGALGAFVGHLGLGDALGLSRRLGLGAGLAQRRDEGGRLGQGHLRAVPGLGVGHPAQERRLGHVSGEGGLCEVSRGEAPGGGGFGVRGGLDHGGLKGVEIVHHPARPGGA